jgi:CHAD domain
MANARVQIHIRPYGTVTENARRIVRARLTELYVWSQYAHDESRMREQHQMRIAAKRLRYTLELFRDYLPEQTGESIKAVKGLQDALGLLHDRDVLIAILRSALFTPDEHTPLFAAVPEARDLPPALLEVLGQRVEMDETSSATAGQPPEKRKQSKQAKHKKHRHALKKSKVHKGKHTARMTEEARSRVRASAEEQAALEQFLMTKAHEREGLYQQFVKRWDKMEEQQFRATILRLVEDAEMTGHYQSHAVAPPRTSNPAQHS